jgi:hypothetical protein
MSWSDRLLSAPTDEPAERKKYSDRLLAPSMDVATTMPQTPDFNPPSAGTVIGQMQQEREANIPESTGVFNSIGNFFTGANRETPESRQYPELTSLTNGMKGDFGPTFKAALGQFMSTSDPQRVDILKKQFPQLGFDVDAKGNVVIDHPEQGKFMLNTPGASGRDAMDVAEGIVQYYPAARGALGLKAPAAVKIATGGAGAGATSVGLDLAAGAFGSEQGVDPWKAGAAAAGEMLLPSTGALLRKAFGSRGMGTSEMLGLTKEGLQNTIDAAKNVGVDLFPAQKTGVMSALEKQGLLANLPGSAQKAGVALREQNRQIYDAVTNFLGSIAPPSAVSTGPSKFRTAADQLRENLVKVRRERASPLYKEAFGEGMVIDTAPVLATVKDITDKFPKGGKISSPVARIGNMIRQAGGDLEKLHNVKTEIDQVIQTGLGANGTPLRGTAKAKLEEVKHSLLGLMDEASPAYRGARETFEKESGAVNSFDQTVLEQARKTKDTDLKKLAPRIFDAAETNPEVVKQTREMIDAVDPEAYDELLRVELERRIGRTKPPTEGIQNAPQQMLNAIFGNDKQTRVLMNALRPEQRDFASNLFLTLKAASGGRPSNSFTATRAEAVQELTKGGAWNWLTRWITAPGQTLRGVGLEMAGRNRQAAIAKVMYDPSYTKDVEAAMRLMKTDPTNAQKNLSALLDSALAATAAGGVN